MHLKSIRYILSALLLILASGLFAQKIDPPFLMFMHHPWVDSVFNSLSQEEKIGQLIWIDAHPDNDIGQVIRLNNAIKKVGAGGIIFSDGQAERLAEMINYFQQISKVPLLIAEDCELRPGMRVEGIERLPDRITLGAIQDDSLIYQMGKAVGQQFKRAGVHMNLDPAAGVDNNSQSFKSFGENPENVSRKSRMYINGLQDNGIISVVKHFPTSLKTGMGILESVDDPEITLKEISDSIKKGLISQADIDEKCRMVLSAKYWAGLSRHISINEDNLQDELSPASIRALIRDLYSNALTVLNNKGNILPVKNLQDRKIAILTVDRSSCSKYQERILSYMPADTFTINNADDNKSAGLLKRLADYDIIIAGIFNTDQNTNVNSGIGPGLNNFLKKLTEGNKTIVSYFGNPNEIAKLDALDEADGLILAYQENDHTEDLAAQLIFGGIGAHGTLPVTINKEWPSGFGITIPGNLRLQYGFPENAGLSSEILNRKIDSIANIGLKVKAYPGCEVMVARKGIVVFHKTYGFQTYDDRISLRKDDLFDLASVTKVSSTLAGLMLLDSEGKFSVDRKLGDYLPEFRKTNKGDLLMKDLLTHQAGLKAWIPFWKETLKPDSSFKRKIFSHEYSEKYPLKVANDLYINKNYRKKIFSEIKKSPLGEKKYVYSDLTFIIAPGIIEKLTGEKWYDFVTNNIYHKLGAYDICFNPYLKYPLQRIVPTEYDSLFRRQLLNGTVHDEGAAMLGGISGHAGLFATANDLMKLMELYRRMGEYGGEQIISKDILEEYTRVQFPENKNRRGLGFDKPLLNNQELGTADAYPAKSATPQSFGHSGYTGTFVWIDPVYEITYIFFSNRVYPTRNNNLLSDLNIRSYILQAIYDSINDTRRTAQDIQQP
jgi:CubicO group peptidase (beta-lactamase class C family)/beta-glucosidase-like glycosyl hydrolase